MKRGYIAVGYNLSLRNLEEMMAERGIAVDHTAILIFATPSRGNGPGFGTHAGPAVMPRCVKKFRYDFTGYGQLAA
ncbi:hypothetical protein [Phyllobacterium trifolii]|uniref:hypothetical protein n=1 Tax=Phyllobacterium trifolii TaxID=300193 RepID=UPI001AEED849|nr:hypothetical protein [Phyllobacterium trifolii]